MQKQVNLNRSTSAPMWSPQILLRPSQIGRLPTGWRRAVSSRALLLETSQPCVPWSSFMDPLERQRLGIRDPGFHSPKKSCWEYLAQLSALSVLWLLLLDSVKIKSREVNVEMLTSSHREISYPWQLKLQIPLLGEEERQERFEHPHLVGTDPSKPIYVSRGSNHVHLFCSV